MGPYSDPAAVTFRPHPPKQRREFGRWSQATEQPVRRRQTKDKEKRNVRAERTAGSARWTIAMIRRPQEHLRLALAGLLAAAAIAVLASASTADAAACSNEGFRAGPSAQLPDCRAYEMVSPPDMNGNGISVVYAIRGDGNAIAYDTINAFGKEAASSIMGQWLGHRGVDGWVSTSINPPTLGRVPSPYDQPVPLGVAGDLSSVLFGTRYPYNLLDQAPYQNISQSGNGDLYRFMPGPSAEWISHGSSLPQTARIDSGYGGASADLSRVFFETAQPLTAATAGSTAPNIYESHNGQLSVVNVDVSGNLIPGGAGTGRSESAVAALYSEFGGPYANGIFNQGHAMDQTAVSTDGQVVYFSAPRTGARQIYVRVDGSTTVDVSRCQFGPCAGEGAPTGATFVAATPDGSSVIFSSTSRLLAAAPEGGGVYRFDLGTKLLSFVTPLEEGRVSATTGDLATLYICGPNGLGVFQAGALHPIAPISCESTGSARNNEPRITPSTGYLFTTKSGPREIPAGEAQVASGEGRVVHGEEMVANGETGNGEAEIRNGQREIANGERKITLGHLFGGYENAGFSEVYRYDPASGKFYCLSCRPDGSAAEAGSGLSEGVGGSRYNPPAEGIEIRNLSDDGTRAVFSSEDALVPTDVNGKIDVYEWELGGIGSCSAASPTYSARSGGCVFLVSSGNDPGGAVLEGMSADGSDVFFASEVALLPIDTSTELQVYDARVGGGIASQQETARPDCEGAGCRGAEASPPTTPQATTNSYAGEGNVKPAARCVKPHKPKKKARHHGRRAHHKSARTQSARAAQARNRRAAKKHGKKTPKPHCTAGANRRAGK
jgi:hypothetical protein